MKSTQINDKLQAKKKELESLVKFYNDLNNKLKETTNQILIKNGEIKALNELQKAKVDK